MLQKTSYAVFLIIYIKCVETTGIESFHGVRTDENPKSSCHKIDNVISTGRCLAKCGILMDKIIMVSHDKSLKICMCCNDIKGSDIIGSNWKTFVPRKLNFSSKIVLNEYSKEKGWGVNRLKIGFLCPVVDVIFLLWTYNE